jgi:hypothetical protein
MLPDEFWNFDFSQIFVLSYRLRNRSKDQFISEQNFQFDIVLILTRKISKVIWQVSVDRVHHNLYITWIVAFLWYWFRPWSFSKSVESWWGRKLKDELVLQIALTKKKPKIMCIILPPLFHFCHYYSRRDNFGCDSSLWTSFGNNNESTLKLYALSVQMLANKYYLLPCSKNSLLVQ